MWPEDVERIAIFLRASGAEGSLEELPKDGDRPPGLLLAVSGYRCSGRILVTLLPAGRTPDEAKVARAGGCTSVELETPPEFPYQGAKVLVDLAVMSAPTALLEIGSGRHILGLAPGQLERLTEAQTADLVAEARTGEVDDRTQG